MYKKYRAFTLAEVLIAMVLFSFVIMLSTAFFDVVMKQIFVHEKIITNTSNVSSIMEDGIIKLRKISSYSKVSDSDKKKLGKPDGYGDGLGQVNKPLTIKETFEFKNGEKIASIQGYFISANSEYDDNTKTFKKIITKYNNIDSTDDYVAFVAYGSYDTPRSYVQNIQLKNSNSFFYHPLDFKEMDVKVSYNVRDENNTFYRVNITPTYSSIYNEDGRDIYTCISNYSYSGLNYRSFSDVVKSKNLKENSISIMKLKGYRGTTTEKKKNYLEYVDKAIIATAVTQNKDGKISLGQPMTTFDNKKIENKFIQLISLPYVENLCGFYDYNLAIAPNKSGTDICNLLDEKDKDYTIYDYLYYKEGDIYKFDFNKNFPRDVRTLLNIPGSKDVEDIVLNESFAFNKKSKDSSGEYPYIRKSYGNTMYFENIIATLKPTGESTLFLKFNNENYNNEKEKKKDIQPFVLLSNNINLETGDFENKSLGNGGFIVYVDTDNKLKYICFVYEKDRDNIVPRIKRNEELIDLNNTNLYTSKDEGYQFNTLQYNEDVSTITGKRDGREKFNIVAVQLDNNIQNTKLNILTRNAKDKNLDTKLQSILSNLEPAKYDSNIILGGVLKQDLTFSDGTNLPAQGKNSNIEVSDVLMYKENLSKNPQGKLSKMNLIADYLYRKYLTQAERNDFDEYFVNTY